MSKILYPKSSTPHPKPKKHHSKSAYNMPYHVFYNDPSEQIDAEWKHYNSELAVKLDSWYRCKFLGFHTQATLYDKHEFNEGVLGKGDS